MDLATGRRVFLVGVDVGGTFTDVCVAEPGGVVRVVKAPSTPDVVTGIADGLALAASRLGVGPGDLLRGVDRFGHGSTVAVNALLQRRGARTGLITTRGFADTLRIGRMAAMTAGLPPELWTHYRRRRPADGLVPRALIREVQERVDFRGRVVAPLDAAEARAAAGDLLAQGVEALAVCTLWSFRNPAHEETLARLAQEIAPEVYVSISSQVAPVLKEYERMATTVVNAALGPVVRAYVSRMAAELRAGGCEREVFLLNSSGGVMPAEEAVERPVQLLGSGPSGGVLAAARLARRLGFADVVTADMGGTSFDVGLIAAGEPLTAPETTVGGLSLLCPGVDMRSIGAGGGSIARARDGTLEVGPASAGSVPGPACYGRGGQDPTVTDADLLLGYLDAERFLAGRMPLRRRAAEEAVERAVARPLGMDVTAAAAGIREVMDQRMADLLRQRTLERGLDPSDCVLFAYGGAGPLHAAAFARAAGMRRVVIPVNATAFSAFGILGADLRLTRQRSVLQRTQGTPDDPAAGLDGRLLEDAFGRLEEDAARDLGRYGAFDPADLQSRRSVRMRFARQVHELAVPAPAACDRPAAVRSLVEAFQRLYAARYGRGARPSAAVVEVTTCVVDLVQPFAAPEPAGRPHAGLPDPRARRRAFLDDWIEVPAYDWDELPAGARLQGPALVDGEGATAWIAPGFTAETDGSGDLLLTDEVGARQR